MSPEKPTFSIYYGEGNVCYGPHGVDLSQFQCAIRRITKPHERTFESLCNWLMAGLMIDPETHNISVQCLINRTSYTLIWELMPITSNDECLSYLHNARQWQWPLGLLVTVSQKPEEPNIEAIAGAGDEDDEEPNNQPGGTAVAEGVVDEGETIPAILQLMEDEDRELHETLMEGCDDDSSDDDDGVSEEWVSSGDFSHLAIHQEPTDTYDCMENQVVQGSRYESLEEVKEAVKCWSLSLMREFRTVECKKNRYEVQCMQQGCPWRVHAYRGKWKDYWECSIVTEHTCHLPGVQKTHRSLTSEFVAGETYGVIKNNLSFESKSIIRYIEEKFKYIISYKKACRAK